MPKNQPKKSTENSEEKKAPTEIQEEEAIGLDPVEAETTTIQEEESIDRVIRSGRSGKNSACPECGAFPTITKIRRPGYELRRCRECGHRFEIKDGD